MPFLCISCVCGLRSCCWPGSSWRRPPCPCSSPAPATQARFATSESCASPSATSISRHRSSWRDGDVDLSVHNDGPDTHELIVVRANGKPLPLRRDGLTVNEAALKSRTVASFEGSGAGGGRSEQVHLPPGTYVLFCNMAGHYLGGMHTTLVVK